MKKKHLLIVIIIVIILCFWKLIISLKNNSIDNIDGNYTIDVGSDSVTIETPKEDIKPISTTSNQILSDFTKNKEKALEKYEYKELTLEIDLTNAEIEELIVCVTDENNNETDVNTGLVGNIDILSDDKKCILSVRLSELYDWESLLKSGKNQSIYNIENFKKLKTITVTILNTYGEDDIYNDDENPAYINIIADKIDEYK